MFRRILNYSVVLRRTSSGSSVKSTNLDEEKLQSVRLTLPGHPKSFLNFQYYDSFPDPNPKDAHPPIVLATHGSPGSHKDFKYMVPTLLAEGYRVIVPNWPGFGITDNPPDDEFSHSNLERAKLLTNFVKALNLKRIDVAIGHSAGCYPYPPFFVDNRDLCKAAVFITPGGATPHKALRPYKLTRFIGRLLTTWLKPVLSYVAFIVSTKVFDMRINHPSHAAVLTRMVANIEFTYLNAVIMSLKKTKNPPIVLVCGKADHLVEQEKSIEYAEKLGCHEYDGIYHIEKREQMENIIKKILSSTGRLEKHHAILFEGGTHFLQKHEADNICKLVKAIVTSNRNKT